MKYWSMIDNGVSCETLADTPMDESIYPVEMLGVKDENGEEVSPFYTLTDISDNWSPVPVSVWGGPAEGFLLIDDYGVGIEVLRTEIEAKGRITGKYADSYMGYVPVTINRKAMVTRKV